MRLLSIVAPVHTFITIVPVNHTANNSHANHQGAQHEKNDEDGAQLFVESAQVLLNIVQAGISANQSGKLKDGIPYLVAALNEIAAIAQRSKDQQRVYRTMVNFMLTRSDDELNQMFVLARNRSLAKQ